MFYLDSKQIKAEKRGNCKFSCPFTSWELQVSGSIRRSCGQVWSPGTLRPPWSPKPAQSKQAISWAPSTRRGGKGWVLPRETGKRDGPPLLAFCLESMIYTCSCLQMFPLLIIIFIKAMVGFVLFYFLTVFLVLCSSHITYSGNFCNIELYLFYFYNLCIKCTKLNRVPTGNGFVFSSTLTS